MKKYKIQLFERFNSVYSRLIDVDGIKMMIKFCLIVMLVLSACKSDDLGDSYYTFTDETIGSYITDRPESFSEFSSLLDTTGVKGLLNAYGKYTCLAPDNAAMIAFYKSKGHAHLSEFSMDSLQKIAFDHILKDVVTKTAEFKEGFLPYLTMSKRYLKIAFEGTSNGVEYTINDNSLLTQKDVELHNGVLHVINNVLSPSEYSLVESIGGESQFSLFYEALLATGLDDELRDIKDESFVLHPDIYALEGTKSEVGVYRVAEERKYGFTALMESNATYAKFGINNLNDLKNYAAQVYDKVYPQDADITDITDQKNSLNRFVAYHLINKKLPKRYFIEKYDNTGEKLGESHSVKIYDMFEYMETMCPNTLMEVRTDRSVSEYNIFNRVNSGDEVRLTDNFDNDAINGVYHEIDNVLAYTTEVAGMLSSKRLRMDAASFFPELTNNNIRRGHATSDYKSEKWPLPHGYVDGIKASEGTEVFYLTSDDRFVDYQGDEIFLKGLYDFEITTPPIPAGTYEIRFGYVATGNRGKAQLYWDGFPSGIPLNLSLTAGRPEIGYETPGLDENDPNGFENDKMMRNRGYMKAPASFKVIDGVWYSTSVVSARLGASALRKIIGIYTFSEDEKHVFGVKAASSGEFMFDYLEFVPLEVLEREGID